MRPIWVTPDKHIFLETFSPIYAQAYDFLVAIAEPLSRPENIHEYVLTDYSLYAAVSIGLSTEQIIKVLEKLCKVELDKKVESYIREATGNYGKVKLILQKNEFFVESQSIQVLEQLMNDDEIKGAVKVPDPVQHNNVDPSGRFLVRLQSTTDTDSYRLAQEVKALTTAAEKTISSSSNQDGGDDDDERDGDGDGQEDKIKLYSFGIVGEKVGKIKERCIKLDLPVLEEYDFRNDKNPKLDIDLRPTTTIRSYQERSLSKISSS